MRCCNTGYLSHSILKTFLLLICAFIFINITKMIEMFTIAAETDRFIFNTIIDFISI